MTTITIKNGDFKKTNFSNSLELLDYLMNIEGYGVLHSIPETEIHEAQEKRCKKALNVEKTQKLNI